MTRLSGLLNNEPARAGIVARTFWHMIQDEVLADTPSFSEGDIFYVPAMGGYDLFKVLKVDPIGGGSICHVLRYQRVDEVPKLEEVDSMEVSLMHTPIVASGFPGAQVLGRAAIKASDLRGYHAYLQMMADDDVILEAKDRYAEVAFQLRLHGRFAEEAEEWSKIIDLDPGIAAPFYNRATALIQLQRCEEAIEDLETFLSLSPDAVEGLIALGECYLESKDFGRARASFEKAVSLAPDNDQAKTLLNETSRIITKNNSFDGNKTQSSQPDHS